MPPGIARSACSCSLKFDDLEPLSPLVLSLLGLATLAWIGRLAKITWSLMQCPGIRHHVLTHPTSNDAG